MPRQPRKSKSERVDEVLVLIAARLNNREHGTPEERKSWWIHGSLVSTLFSHLHGRTGIARESMALNRALTAAEEAGLLTRLVIPGLVNSTAAEITPDGLRRIQELLHDWELQKRFVSDYERSVMAKRESA